MSRSRTNRTRTFRDPAVDLPAAVGGKTYIDPSRGAAVSCLGRDHPRVIEAIKRQIAYLRTSFFTTEVSERLADHLIAGAPEGPLGDTIDGRSGNDVLPPFIATATDIVGLLVEAVRLALGRAPNGRRSGGDAGGRTGVGEVCRDRDGRLALFTGLGRSWTFPGWKISWGRPATQAVPKSGPSIPRTGQASPTLVAVIRRPVTAPG